MSSNSCLCLCVCRQRQLDDQQLDDSQRERIEEFLRCKKDIHELHPEDFTKISELGSGNWGVVSRVRYNRTNLIMAKKTIRLDIRHEVATQIVRELEVSLLPFIATFPHARLQLLQTERQPLHVILLIFPNTFRRLPRQLWCLSFALQLFCRLYLLPSLGQVIRERRQDSGD